jgi:hypothetical protein
VLRPPTQLIKAAFSATEFGSGTYAVPTQPAGRSAGCNAIAVNRGVIGGPTAPAGELTAAELGAAELGTAELGRAELAADEEDAATLVAGLDVVPAEVVAPAVPLALDPELLHPVSASGTHTAMIRYA